MIPDWLTEQENYIPKTDQDAFTNRSILSFLELLSKMKRSTFEKEHIIRVNPVVKVGGTFLLLLLVSMSHSFLFVCGILVYLLTSLSFLKGNDILKIISLTGIVTLVTFVILIPAAYMGNTYSATMIPLKVFVSVVSVNILSYTVKWSDIICGLKCFFLPDLFLLVLDITIKYIYLLGDLAVNMLYALKLRSVGKNREKYNALSGVIGTMFLHSKVMAEDMYAAMECRGFTGDYKRISQFSLGFFDGFYILFYLALMLSFYYIQRGF